MHQSLPAEVRNGRGLISLKKAAALVDVDQKTIRMWIAAGHLQGYKLNGNMWRVSSHEVLALAQPIFPADSGGAA
ncbi:helix-turn-helix domain-containing protein [Nocardia sp. CA-120079]|uniref:helix-turn-helix domain-containing protein n=1 Tax=Nocardia sp. CA-120079 TaxID=3239974 RepID=UPI003D961B1C